MQNQSELEPDLDGSTNVLLAPVPGPETRRDLDPEYFHKRPAVFVAKFAFALVLIAAGWLWVALQTTVVSVVVTVLTTGLMYAHLVELQHECLHEHAFRSRTLNRLFGFMCGVPMFSSYSHYKYDHLRHHAFLGTPQNREFFNYQFHNLDSPIGFIVAPTTSAGTPTGPRSRPGAGRAHQPEHHQDRRRPADPHRVPGFPGVPRRGVAPRSPAAPLPDLGLAAAHRCWSPSPPTS